MSNPIVEWETAFEKAFMVRGEEPRVCVMGHMDYAAMAGALAITHGMTVRYNTFKFHGVRIMECMAQERGMMFA